MTRCKDSWHQGYAMAIKKPGHLFVFYISLVVSLVVILLISPFYMMQGDLAWYAIGFFLFFAGLILFIALMYYFPLCLALENDGPFKTLKKCFIVFFDNFWFTIYILTKNICDLVISFFTMFLMPGVTGVCITMNTAVYFMMLRYDWMEENKVGKHNVSADMYLAPVFEQYSQRNLRTLFFPWKK